MTPSTVIVVHGGAGATPAERHDRLRSGVRKAARFGNEALAGGASALDAVVAAVRVLEDDPEFNAGHGSALTRDGRVETDAAVMDGATRRIGAVAAVPDLGNAIALARAVLEDGEHVMIAGPAAWRFAAEVGIGITPAPEGSLITERQRARLAEVLARGTKSSGGTVGAVARDREGRFAAATSTGGIMGKRSGRVGDTPVPGAGTWADERVAISATGDGEAILRVALARRVAERVMLGISLQEAAADALDELRRITAGTAGLIAVNAVGLVGVQLSTMMPVAWIFDGRAGDSMGEAL